MTFKKHFSAVILLMITLILFTSAKPIKPLMPEGSRIKRSGFVQGVIINTISSNDFPYKSNLDNNTLSSEIEKMIKYLHSIGINSVFYEAVGEFEAMYSTGHYPESKKLRTEKTMNMSSDPLKLIKQQAQKYDIDVYAVIDTHKIGSLEKANILASDYDIIKNKDNILEYEDDAYFHLNDETAEYSAEVCRELVKKYNLDGIIMRDINMDAYSSYDISILSEHLSEECKAIKTSITSVNPDVVLGMMFDSDFKHLYDSEKLARNMLDTVSIDIVLPKISHSIDGDYEIRLGRWYKTIAKYGVPMITINNGYKIFSPETEDDYCENRFELNYQALINEKHDVYGMVINDYCSLVDRFTGVSSAVSTLFLADVKPEEYDYRISNKLTVNFAKSGVVHTDKKFVYVTGTSDPSKALYLNDELVKNVMPNGIFGVNLPVKEDSNLFIFRQGQEYSIIRIFKEKEEGLLENQLISNIVEGSPFPEKSQFVDTDEILELKCVAPAGSVITATLDKISVHLEQVSDVHEGIATEYIGEIRLPKKYAAGAVTDLGKVSYAMTYDGKISVSRSAGNIFAAGPKSSKAVQVDDYIAYVYSKPDLKSPSLYTMKIGAKDYVENELDDFYELKSGGYISKNAVQLVKGNGKIDASYTSYQVESDDKGESIILMGNSAANIKTKFTDNSVIFTFYNTKVLPDIVPSNTQQFKNIIKIKVAPDTYQLQFIFKDGIKPWGYNYKYFGDSYENLRIDFKFKPSLSDKVTKPLENVFVLLDPACVDTEFDTSDVMENYGLHEAQINLNIAMKTKDILEALGATVQITRYDNNYISDFERMSNASQANADFFISIAHNHAQGTADRKGSHGIQVEYSDKTWSEFADILTKSMSNSTGRKVISPVEKDDIVTQITSCPAVMLKNGYLSNAEEYSDILDPLSTYRTACGITQAILNMLT